MNVEDYLTQERVCTPENLIATIGQELAAGVSVHPEYELASSGLLITQIGRNNDFVQSFYPGLKNPKTKDLYFMMGPDFSNLCRVRWYEYRYINENVKTSELFYEMVDGFLLPVFYGLHYDKVSGSLGTYSLEGDNILTQSSVVFYITCLPSRLIMAKHQ